MKIFSIYFSFSVLLQDHHTHTRIHSQTLKHFLFYKYFDENYAKYRWQNCLPEIGKMNIPTTMARTIAKACHRRHSSPFNITLYIQSFVCICMLLNIFSFVSPLTTTSMGNKNFKKVAFFFADIGCCSNNALEVGGFAWIFSD